MSSDARRRAVSKRATAPKQQLTTSNDTLNAGYYRHGTTPLFFVIAAVLPFGSYENFDTHCRMVALAHREFYGLKLAHAPAGEITRVRTQ